MYKILIRTFLIFFLVASLSTNGETEDNFSAGSCLIETINNSNVDSYFDSLIEILKKLNEGKKHLGKISKQDSATDLLIKIKKSIETLTCAITLAKQYANSPDNIISQSSQTIAENLEIVRNGTVQIQKEIIDNLNGVTPKEPPGTLADQQASQQLLKEKAWKNVISGFVLATYSAIEHKENDKKTRSKLSKHKRDSLVHALEKEFGKRQPAENNPHAADVSAFLLVKFLKGKWD